MKTVKILRIDFKPNDIAEVTIIKQNGQFEMLFVSMTVFKEVIDLEKLEQFLTTNLHN